MCLKADDVYVQNSETIINKTTCQFDKRGFIIVPSFAGDKYLALSTHIQMQMFAARHISEGRRFTDVSVQLPLLAAGSEVGS